MLIADESDDASDDWTITANTSGTLTFGNDIASAGTAVAHITVTPHATVASSTTAIAGGATVGGTLGVTGVISPTTHVDMPDDANVKLGTGDDMQLYHDGSNSYITNATGALKLATETSGIAVTIGHGTSEVTVGDNLTVTGDLTVSGTTTTVNSTTVSIADPIFEIGASGSDDNLDRGLKMKYNSGGAKVAFMGYDDSDGKFSFIPDASESSNTFSGTAGILKAALEGNADTATTLSTASHTVVTTLANLVSVGTISTGVWNATAVGTTKGGTGLTSHGSSGQLMVSTGSGFVMQSIDGGTYS